MHRKYILIRLNRVYSADGNCFLTNSGKPFGDFSLPEQNKHLFFNHPRLEQAGEQRNQSLVGKSLAVECHFNVNGDKINSLIGSTNSKAYYIFG